MTSLPAQAKSYGIKKAEATKLRRKGENKLKVVLSQKRRSSSGLASLERKKEATIRQRDHIMQLLNQALAQKESLERLKTMAEERIRQEQDARDQVKQQSEYGGPDEKAAAAERLKFIDEKIRELRAEIKEREAAEARLVNTIANYEREKSTLLLKLQKEIHAKPGLIEQLKASTKTEARLRPQVKSMIKREAQAEKALALARKKLAVAQRKRAQLAAKRRKAKRKAKRKIVKRKSKTRTKKSPKRKKISKRKAKMRSRRRRRTVKRKASKSRRRK
ncbi:MAG: hypothetical protein E6K91_00680 [Thaumarchaeota archaeon]|nr:MAG: hypothetical protein E6K91_00680 [Nitrososphaerota archaeon]